MSKTKNRKRKGRPTRSFTTFERTFVSSSDKVNDKKLNKFVKHFHKNIKSLKYESDRALVREAYNKMNKK
jgi:hypothetical protein